MNTIIEKLTEKMSSAFEQAGYDGGFGKVITSNRPDLCDFQCDGALKGAKQYRKSPMMIAEDVAKYLEGTEEFKSVSVVPPGFINLTISNEVILGFANGMAEDRNMGIPQLTDKETLIIDYGGANIAKPLHIGHLRTAIIGEALKRLMRLLGYKVIGDVHLGDWGLQIGLVIAELAQRNPGFSCFTVDYKDGDALPEITTDSLNEIYPFASKKSKEDAAFSEKAHQMTFELQKRTPGCIALWKEILNVSVSDLKLNYGKLGIDFDLWYGESDADEYIEKVISILEEKELLKESDGAKIVDVLEETDKRPIPPVIIIKSDGAVNYATTDIATLYQRQQDFAPEKVWYVVDKRQELHFLQVFRTTKKAEIVPQETELLHIGYGTMNGQDGKPYKTRDGGVMRLGDMVSTVTNSAKEKISTSEYMDGQSHEETARKIGVAAIKFGDLINHPSKDYIFDLDRFMSFEGKTGPYILYMIARINSLLAKTEGADFTGITGIYADEDRELLLKILGTADTFWAAAREKAPNYIAENAYQIASVFSQFYHNNKIVAEKDKEKQSSWISLCLLVKSLLELHLDILGIEPVEFM